MLIDGTVDITIDVEGNEVRLEEVPYSGSVESDPGCRTLSNGDPGYPSSSETHMDADWSQRDAVESVEEAILAQGGNVPVDLKKAGARLLRAIGDAVCDEIYEKGL
jgi:hypothetical protein